MTLNLCLIFALPVRGIDSRGPDVAIKCGGANFSFIIYMCYIFTEYPLQIVFFGFGSGFDIGCRVYTVHVNALVMMS